MTTVNNDDGFMNSTAFQQLQRDQHLLAFEKGFWDFVPEGAAISRLFDEHPTTLCVKLMKMVTETGEAMVELQRGDRAKFGEELADIGLVLVDLAEAVGIDLESTMRAKHAINKTRPTKHGKRF